MKFKDWVQQVADVVNKRVSKEANVEVDPGGGLTKQVRISLYSVPLQITIPLNVFEFKHNTYNQRRKLAKMRRINCAKELEDAGKDILRVAKKLQR